MGDKIALHAVDIPDAACVRTNEEIDNASSSPRTAALKTLWVGLVKDRTGIVRARATALESVAYRMYLSSSSRGEAAWGGRTAVCVGRAAATVCAAGRMRDGDAVAGRAGAKKKREVGYEQKELKRDGFSVFMQKNGLGPEMRRREILLI